MARKTVKSAVQLTSWDDVNEALRQIGENERDIIAAENIMNEQIAAAKLAAEAKTAALRENTGMLALALQEYATAHRKDMGDAKSKTMTFGTVSFRQSTSVVLPKGADLLAGIVARLRALGMTDCIVQPPAKIDKNALKKYSPDKIIEAGASIKTGESFGYDVDKTKIERK